MRFRINIFTLMACLVLTMSSSVFASVTDAEEALSKGKRLYADGRYEEAMDNFINVFVTGSTDQIAEANEYVNLIHFDRGGVVAPTQVPYNEEIEKNRSPERGKVLFDKQLEKEPGVPTNPDKSTVVWKEVFTKEVMEDIPEPEDSEPNADPFGSRDNNKTAKNLDSGTNEEITEKDSAQEENNENVTEVIDKEIIIPEEESFPKGSKSKIRYLQKKDEKQQRQELIDSLVAKLNAREDVQVYLRGGRVDAIDIDSSALFFGSAISKVSSPILDDVYALMILEDSPAYVILPEGSYTGDVTLHGVRQAVALNSYLINRGISPSKMNLNMGLTTQEPPEKFSNLAGVSVVFDYDGKSRLKSKLQEKNLPPTLSLAVYPFEEITPSIGEIFVIDFSVIEASAPIKEWIFQIVSHASDGHYYVIKQLSGTDALNYQTFWNGRKRYFGHLLPLGKYTVVLKAKDTAGRESILKRQLTLKEAPEKDEVLVIKTESEVKKSEELKKGTIKSETKNLNYSQKRLWTKPAIKRIGNIEEENEKVSSVVSTKSVTKTSETVYESSSTDNIAGVPQETETSLTVNSYGATNNPYSNTVTEEE